jgi:hypothetical protein
MIVLGSIEVLLPGIVQAVSLARRGRTEVEGQVAARLMRKQMAGVSLLAAFLSGDSLGQASTNRGGAPGSSASSTREAKKAAPIPANGRRAHQMWRVEMWPWQIGFSGRIARRWLSAVARPL